LKTYLRLVELGRLGSRAEKPYNKSVELTIHIDGSSAIAEKLIVTERGRTNAEAKFEFGFRDARPFSFRVAKRELRKLREVWREY